MNKIRKHTPGPWGCVPVPSNERYDHHYQLTRLSGFPLTSNPSAEESAATADLIGAAPRLLQALETVLADYRTEGCPDPGCSVCAKSKAAIAFAREVLREVDGDYT